LKEDIKKGFSEIRQKFCKKIKNVFGKDFDVIKIFLTNYGVGGSYKLPNEIILKFPFKKGAKGVAHEIIHLLIQEDVIKYKISHWEKERIVDLILHSREFAFLDYNYFEPYKIDVGHVDSLFMKYFFRNRDKFFSEISSNSN